MAPLFFVQRLVINKALVLEGMDRLFPSDAVIPVANTLGMDLSIPICLRSL